MKLLIDCNEVFDILTRGPFPSGGEHDQAVEHHLRSCHDCRQLAEALRPAVELFHESLTAQETTNLPEYHGLAAPLNRAMPPDQPMFRSLPRDLDDLRFEPAGHDHPFASHRPERAPARGSRAALLVQGLIGMALTAAIVLTVISLGTSVRNMNRYPGRLSSQSLVSKQVVSGAEAARRLLALQLPSDCLLDKLRETAASGRSLEQQIARAWEERTLDCCTHCHNSTQHGLKSGLLVATLLNNCTICHKG